MSTKQNRWHQTCMVDAIQCLIYSRRLPLLAKLAKVSDSYSLSDLSSGDQILALIHLVAICDKLNWDFVLGPLAGRLWNVTRGFSFEGLNNLTVREFRGAFGDYKRLDGPIGYARRLARLRVVAEQSAESRLPDIILAADRIEGINGVAAAIRRLSVFREDPLFKKGYALLNEMVRRGLFSPDDPNSLQPAIDYHILRLYLRTGRTSVLDEDLATRLINRGRVRIEAITDLRRATAEAMKYTASISGIPVSSLNDIEWRFSRRACRRDQTWCTAGERSCPLESSCPSSKLVPTLMITEPASNHGLY